MFMIVSNYPKAIILTILVLLGSAVANSIWAQNDKPLDQNWAPSQWGADDKVGSVNRTTPDMVIRAARLVRRGKVATLGKVYQQDMPYFGSRGWRLTIPGMPTLGPIGPDDIVANDEYVATELGQVGTQFDGPGHIGVRTSQGDFFYNGRFLHDPEVTSYGLGPLGVEHIAQVGFVCRGVLLDAVALRGATLPIPTRRGMGDPGIVTDADVKAMIQRQGIDPIGEGDCVFLYTGHGNLWHPTDWDQFDAAEKQRRIAEFTAGSPGFGISACEYLASRGIILWGWRHRIQRSGCPRFRRRKRYAVRVPREDVGAQRHLEHRKPRSQSARRRPGLRISVFVVAAEDQGRHRLTG